MPKTDVEFRDLVLKIKKEIEKNVKIDRTSKSEHDSFLFQSFSNGLKAIDIHRSGRLVVMKSRDGMNRIYSYPEESYKEAVDMMIFGEAALFWREIQANPSVDNSLDAIYEFAQKHKNDSQLLTDLILCGDPEIDDVDKCICLLSSTLQRKTDTAARQSLLDKLTMKLLDLGEDLDEALLGLWLNP